MKQERHNAIIEILRNRDIYTQEELTAALSTAGFSVAQATISRDIRELGLIKENTKKGQRYVAPENSTANPIERVFRDGLVKVEYAGNMLVLHTITGMAMAVAYALDNMQFPEILGSVAGDDVIICVVKSKSAAAALTEKLQPENLK
ncbi:MAG: arginine repressor [Clostridiales bacterium]|jgi:transcriptional regulator of arginine metabolism|nr:arginine repressor [Clostridiales bacterium]